MNLIIGYIETSLTFYKSETCGGCNREKRCQKQKYFIVNFHHYFYFQIIIILNINRLTSAYSPGRIKINHLQFIW